MEPTLPTPTNLETQSTAPNTQAAPAMSSVEAVPAARPENAQEGLSAAAASALASQQAAQTPVTPVQPMTAAHGAGQAPTNDSPQIADDVDVIEKEWVDKAKRIVSATKADPRKQEHEVSKLQADYLLKRYNKQTKLTE
jgi:hypothetical protein